ncbi:hypothetical protein K491DRAFT_712056 [Lophiostoma macrostomum CBS 122681]|uniref:DUF7587 domain-containing protein n=1 Tax=Lophiostoma macrostomum CBS 122681 TaxID=1314788 RepID=A0A6A6TL33_9PLEO|nr:hypothetical protein K491DRAFT_712056 [Lophiostoma macrostomum CBS 122681]
MSSQSSRPPQAFYRAQHKDSFTYYDAEHGGYYMDYCHWINKVKIDSHLDWSARPKEPTPFISIFDNKDAATRRANFFRGKGHKEIKVAKIQPTTLQRTILPIRFANEVVNLRAWRDPDGITFLAPVDLRQHLHINLATSDEHEWLVVEWIPPGMIRGTTEFSSDTVWDQSTRTSYRAARRNRFASVK